jgi:hypothetical protein
VEITLNAILIDRPQPTEQAPRHLCLDKAYDTPACHRVTEEADYSAHIRHIGEDKLDADGEKTHPACRWAVERTPGWLSRCHGIPVRYEKKANNYMAVLKLACAPLWYRRLHRLETAERHSKDELRINTPPAELLAGGASLSATTISTSAFRCTPLVARTLIEGYL